MKHESDIRLASVALAESRLRQKEKDFAWLSGKTLEELEDGGYTAELAALPAKIEAAKKEIERVSTCLISEL